MLAAAGARRRGALRSEEGAGSAEPPLAGRGGEARPLPGAGQGSGVGVSCAGLAGGGAKGQLRVRGGPSAAWEGGLPHEGS